MATQAVTNLEEYFALPDQQGLERELLHGRLIELGRPSLLHNFIGLTLARAISAWSESANASIWVAYDCEFVLSPETVCAPDVFVITKEFAAQAARQYGAMVGAPFIAVEIASKNDRLIDLDEKIAAYLAAGTAAVLAAYPRKRNIILHGRTGEIRDFRPGQLLTLPDLLPGFSIAVDEIFDGPLDIE